MSVFEFMMVLLSIIVGLGISELLVGVARILRRDGVAGFALEPLCLAAILLIAFLQYFWEIWHLHTLETWTFPAMLMMLSGPITLSLIAHVLFPSEEGVPLLSHYYARARILYCLGLAAAMLGVLFRPVALGYPLFVPDNATSLPTIVLLGVLAWSSRPVVHRVLLPLGLALIVIDTIVISYQIN